MNMAESEATYWITRLLFQRALAVVYLIGFISVVHQFKALLGEKGLLPVPQFVREVSFWKAPSIFHWIANDTAFLVFGWLGVLLALFALSGISEKFGNPISMITWALLWILYLSYVNVGQTFYGFGWESLLVEVGFYAIFLGSAASQPSFLTILLLRWTLFRLMFGAGLIKIRGDECWRDLTCLNYHYETQPIPNPLSWYSHRFPGWFNSVSVMGNHVVELIVPFFYFAPQPFAAVAGIITILFHGWLFASGNFAFLGLLTMVLAIPTIPDKYLRYIIPSDAGVLHPITGSYAYAIYLLCVVVVLLSAYPVKNLFSSRQLMNASFNPLHLVGTYGAFGSITRPRYEVIIEGTDAAEINAAAQWREYEFFGKPGDPKRRPIQVAPYHLRLDWLMWFQPFRARVTENSVQVPSYDPWFVHFIAKLLQNDQGILSLMRTNPFPDKAPTYIRARFYKYEFTTRAERKKTRAWWRRTLIGEYFPPVALDDPQFQAILQSRGW